MIFVMPLEAKADVSDTCCVRNLGSQRLAHSPRATPLSAELNQLWVAEGVHVTWLAPLCALKLDKQPLGRGRAGSEGKHHRQLVVRWVDLRGTVYATLDQLLEIHSLTHHRQ